jgi:hypothetical protein
VPDMSTNVSKVQGATRTSMFHANVKKAFSTHFSRVTCVALRPASGLCGKFPASPANGEYSIWRNFRLHAVSFLSRRMPSDLRLPLSFPQQIEYRPSFLSCTYGSMRLFI